MSNQSHLGGSGAARKTSPEHYRNEVARMLAALDLMSIDQIRFFANRAGIKLSVWGDRKALLEEIRRQLTDQSGHVQTVSDPQPIPMAPRMRDQSRMETVDHRIIVTHRAEGITMECRCGWRSALHPGAEPAGGRAQAWRTAFEDACGHLRSPRSPIPPRGPA